jgi:hypothetical protein
MSSFCAAESNICLQIYIMHKENIYIATLPIEQQAPMLVLRDTILQNLPAGFEEQITEKGIHYVVPLRLYPKGYHTKPANQPLPFLSLVAQKNAITLYHMGIYSDAELLAWWQKAYQEQVATKLDMGKSCIRFKKTINIPYQLIAELLQKMTPSQWIAIYESTYLKPK